MTDYARIIIREHELPLGRGRTYTYELEGPPNAPVLIPNWVDLKDLPWKFVFYDNDYMYDGKIYIRASAFTWFVIAKHKLRQAWQWFAYRLIITAMVWGLAYTEPGVTPSWSDLGKKRPK